MSNAQGPQGWMHWTIKHQIHRYHLFIGIASLVVLYLPSGAQGPQINTRLGHSRLDSVFILFKETDFNTVLACLGGKVYQWWGVINFCCRNRGGRLQFYQCWLFGTPFRRKCQPPNGVGSRCLLMGPWRGSGVETRQGSKLPPDAFGFL